MAAPIVTVVETINGVQYTGSNGTDVAAAVPGAEYIGEAGGVLTIETGIGQWQIATGEWIRFREFGQSVDVFSAFGDAFWTGVMRPVPQLVTREGSANIAASLLGGPQDVEVTLDEPMSDANYIPRVQLLGAQGLLGIGGHEITGWTVDDEETVTVHLSSAATSAAVTGGVYVAATELV